jgi:hypothetical protein
MHMPICNDLLCIWRRGEGGRGQQLTSPSLNRACARRAAPTALHCEGCRRRGLALAGACDARVALGSNARWVRGQWLAVAAGACASGGGHLLAGWAPAGALRCAAACSASHDAVQGAVHKHRMAQVARRLGGREEREWRGIQRLG